MFRREKNRALHMRLTEWGEWRNQPITGLGYKPKTIEHTMMEMGGIYSDGGFRSITPNYKPNRRCAEVDRVILEMPYEPRYSLFAKYVLQLHKQELINNWPKSIRHFYNSLSKAHKNMADQLNYEWE